MTPEPPAVQGASTQALAGAREEWSTRPSLIRQRRRARVLASRARSTTTKAPSPSPIYGVCDDVRKSNRLDPGGPDVRPPLATGVGETVGPWGVPPVSR